MAEPVNDSSLAPEIRKFIDGNRLLITGANGMLGTAFREVLTDWDCDLQNCLFLPKSRLNVAKSGDFQPYYSFEPTHVLHCAGLVNADFSEEYPQLASEVIEDGARNLEAFAKSCGAIIFYPQTFLIFDGAEPIVDEYSLVIPLNVYGNAKYRAEQYLLEKSPNILSSRLGGFFGGESIDKNFVGKISREIARLISIESSRLEVGNRRWQPTYTHDIARNILLLLARRKNGVYNIACEGDATFFDVAKSIVDTFSLTDGISITEVDYHLVEQHDKATRPASVYLSTQKLNQEGLNLQRHWQESLSEYLRGDYFKKLFRY